MDQVQLVTLQAVGGEITPLRENNLSKKESLKGLYGIYCFVRCLV